MLYLVVAFLQNVKILMEEKVKIMKKIVSLILVLVLAIGTIGIFAACAPTTEKTTLEIKYTYGGQFFGDANITAKMNGWYSAGTELVFACGGGIYTSAVEAAKSNNAKVVGVDVDQGYIDNCIVTSSMKALEESVMTALSVYFAGDWNLVGGTVATLGLDSTLAGQAAKDYVGIPTATDSWRFDNFTMAQYQEILTKIKANLPASNNASNPNYAGTITAGNYIALVTDVGTIDDESFNQAAWQGVKNYAEANNIEYNYFQPNEDSLEARATSIALAIENGADVIVCPGFLFEETIFAVQDQYPDVAFILLDGTPNHNYEEFKIADNTFCILYQEEQAGFLAGYAAVMDGYTKLGFLGGMAVPAVVRYGYGFIQGADYAIQVLNGTASDVITISNSTDARPTVSSNTTVIYID